MGRVSEPCFCAFCREPRRVYAKKHITFSNLVLSAITSLLVMLILWQDFDPKVLFIFVLCLMVAETFVQLRWRLTLACPHCQFDPVLYMKSPVRAAARVSEFYELRKQDSGFYLSSNPLLKLARLQAKTRRQQKTHSALVGKTAKAGGQILSKTI